MNGIGNGFSLANHGYLPWDEADHALRELASVQLCGGRAEAQAAHIMRVEAGGPDTAANGIALSGTVHWMFDRGLVSLSDTGKVLLSRKINDVEGVKNLLHGDGRARFPSEESQRPHPRFLAWHRE